MGMGDELMAAGHAARVSREAGGAPVNILDRFGRVRFHELWEGLDFIKPVRVPGAIEISNGPGCRPYIRYPFTIETGQTFTGWRARDNRPVISPHLVGARRDGGFVYIEPTIKPLANVNKQWRGYQALVDSLPDVTFVQCGEAEHKAHALRGKNVRFEVTDRYLEAVARLNEAALYVGAEGGMHHAAAALNVPAVVIFGGAPSIEATGTRTTRTSEPTRRAGAGSPAPLRGRDERDHARGNGRRPSRKNCNELAHRRACQRRAAHAGRGAAAVQRRLRTTPAPRRRVRTRTTS
jgi:hypothetical protein